MKVPPIKFSPTPAEYQIAEIEDNARGVKVKVEFDRTDHIRFSCVLCNHQMVTKTEITKTHEMRTEWICVRCTGIGCEQNLHWRKWRKNSIDLPADHQPKVTSLRREAAEIKNAGLDIPRSFRALYAYMYLEKRIPVRHLKRIGGMFLPEYQEGTLRDSCITFNDESVSTLKERSDIQQVLSEIYPGLDLDTQYKFVYSLLSRYRFLNRIHQPKWDFLGPKRR